jgi:hypothetical protein
VERRVLHILNKTDSPNTTQLNLAQHYLALPSTNTRTFCRLVRTNKLNTGNPSSVGLDAAIISRCIDAISCCFRYCPRIWTGTLGFPFFISKLEPFRIDVVDNTIVFPLKVDNDDEEEEEDDDVHAMDPNGSVRKKIVQLTMTATMAMDRYDREIIFSNIQYSPLPSCTYL